MEKVKLSNKQVEDVRGTVGCFLRDRYGMLQGCLLTTMDSAIESDRQVEGMKARIRDIQGKLWDEIYRQEASILGSIFWTDVTKAPETDSASKIEKAVEKFIEHVNAMISDEFGGFLFRLENLLGMIFSDSKLKCVVEEVDRIVRSSRYNLTHEITRALRDKFGIDVS